MKYIGTKASSMIDGALIPTMPSPLAVATTNPRLAARLYAGAVDATPTTMLDTSPSAPPLRPLLACSGNPISASWSVDMAAFRPQRYVGVPFGGRLPPDGVFPGRFTKILRIPCSDRCGHSVSGAAPVRRSG